jgi:hypothetical protein
MCIQVAILSCWGAVAQLQINTEHRYLLRSYAWVFFQNGLCSINDKAG